MNRIEKPSFSRKVGNLAKDVLLHHHIQGGGRLIHDQQGWVQRQGNGDHGALAHTAG